jgi:hypothetical protein
VEIRTRAPTEGLERGPLCGVVGDVILAERQLHFALAEELQVRDGGAGGLDRERQVESRRLPGDAGDCLCDRLIDASNGP